MLSNYFLVLLVFSGIAFISADVSTATIDKDLNEIMKLTEQFKSTSPQVVRQVTETTCQMITKCCPHIQSTFLSTALSRNTEELMNQCFGKTGSSSFQGNIRACTPLATLAQITRDEKLMKFSSIASKKASQSVEDMKIIIDICTDKEKQSMLCDWNTTHLQRECQQKLLQHWAKQGDSVYNGKVQKTKESATKINEELKNMF